MLLLLVFNHLTMSVAKQILRTKHPHHCPSKQLSMTTFFAEVNNKILQWLRDIIISFVMVLAMCVFLFWTPK